MSQPCIIGLSHIFGEANDLSLSIQFWKSHGWQLGFEWQLPVPPEKQAALLGHSNSAGVDLAYLTRSDQKLGLEFLDHKTNKHGPKSNTPSLSLAFKGNERRRFQDPDGNHFLEDPDLLFARTIIARVPQLDRAAELLQRLGFRRTDVAQAEIKLLELTHYISLSLENSLLPQLSVRVLLTQDARAPEHLLSNQLGWNGLSLLTPSLGIIRQLFPIHSAQRIIEAEGSVKNVAFLNDDGLLLEFLEIDRSRTNRPS